MDALVKNFSDLEREWEELRKNQNDENVMKNEFPILLKSTLRLFLDVS
jgi:hypothetical protein